MASDIETEVKIRLARAADALGFLYAAGFRMSEPRLFEVNILYDTPDAAVRRSGAILRLREAGERSVLTWKGRRDSRSHKTREELETTVGSAEVLRQILTRLGYSAVFRYEKYRTEFRRPTEPFAGVVTLDETPIGDFIEIEGPDDWIDKTAARLGFEQKDYVLESYGALYLADCQRHGVQPANMVFASH